MSQLRYFAQAPRARRVVVILALTLPGLGWVVAGSAAPAQACTSSSNNDHCYAVVFDGDTATNDGQEANISASCLHVNNDAGDNFADNELWDESSDGSYWEEVGLTSGFASDGTYYSNKTWFWADSRPGGGYNEHEPSNLSSAGTNVAYTVEIFSAGNEEWDIWGGNSFGPIGTSTSQSATLVQGLAGTEYTSSGGADMRDAGVVNELYREGTNGLFYSWGSDGSYGSNSGPSHYISGSWSGSAESWSYSC